MTDNLELGEDGKPQLDYDGLDDQDSTAPGTKKKYETLLQFSLELETSTVTSRDSTAQIEERMRVERAARFQQEFKMQERHVKDRSVAQAKKQEKKNDHAEMGNYRTKMLRTTI